MAPALVPLPHMVHVHNFYTGQCRAVIRVNEQSRLPPLCISISWNCHLACAFRQKRLLSQKKIADHARKSYCLQNYFNFCRNLGYTVTEISDPHVFFKIFAKYNKKENPKTYLMKKYFYLIQNLSFRFWHFVFYDMTYWNWKTEIFSEESPDQKISIMLKHTCSKLSPVKFNIFVISSLFEKV